MYGRAPPTGMGFFKDVMSVTVGMLTKYQSIFKILTENVNTQVSN